MFGSELAILFGSELLILLGMPLLEIGLFIGRWLLIGEVSAAFEYIGSWLEIDERCKISFW